jgi:phytoene dehydrogenase-like protein
VPAEIAEGMVEMVFAKRSPSSSSPSSRCAWAGRAPIVQSSAAPRWSRRGEFPTKSLLYFVSYQPYNLADGGPARWDAIKDRVADTLLDRATHFIAGLTPDNVIAREIDSPLDIERYSPNSMINGDFSGVGFQLFHLGGYRPTPELAQYSVPGVDRLYPCGPFMHPGGGIFAVGWPTAIKICDDLGIDFEKVGR